MVQRGYQPSTFVSFTFPPSGSVMFYMPRRPQMSRASVTRFWSVLTRLYLIGGTRPTRGLVWDMREKPPHALCSMVLGLAGRVPALCGQFGGEQCM